MMKLNPTFLALPSEPIIPHPKVKPRLVLPLTITLHTQKAKATFFHSDKGVLPLAKKMKAVWEAASFDDPFADQFLVKTCQAFKTYQDDLQAIRNDLMQTLEAQSNFQVSLPEHQKPRVIPLHFQSAYGNWAARLIVDFDVIVRAIFAANRLGLTLPKPSREWCELLQTRFYEVFATPDRWQLTGVTRQDVRQQTDLAQQAERLMMKLHPEVLSGQLRARYPYAPSVPEQPAKRTLEDS